MPPHEHNPFDLLPGPGWPETGVQPSAGCRR
jgi:hypothetical protein